MAFKRLQYEKLSAVWTPDEVKENYSISADDEGFIQLCSLMKFWDLDHPDIRELFVWFKPNKKCKRFAERITGEKFAQDDYRWWNVIIDFEDKLSAPTSENYAERFSFSPEAMTGEWAQFIPTNLTWAITLLYFEAAKGLKYRAFDNLSDILALIREGMEQEEVGGPIKKHDFALDREVLVKELFDFNKLPYPTNPETAFDFLCRVGFIIQNRNGLKVEYALAQVAPDPAKVLSFPQDWEKRVEEFVRTGSIVFSYLSLDEILAS